MIDITFDDNKVCFLDIRKYKDGIKTPGLIGKLDQGIARVISHYVPHGRLGNAMLKVHIGEAPNDTYMKPELLAGAIDYLVQSGVLSVAFGDTTVAYSGPRSYKENPEDNCSTYLKLAGEHGFNTIPFIVLDRPITKKSGLEFDQVDEEYTMNDDRIRYKKVYPAGGYLKSELLINNAHLTGHLLAKNALCIKSISMGLSSYRGKIQLHQNLYPEIDAGKCTLCEECIKDCPEKALTLKDEKVQIDSSTCIGCAQCASICPESVIEMESPGITTWNKGNTSLDIRMAEYALALLSIHEGTMINVGHLYSITGMCDCMETHQKPNCDDIGIVIGANPFAVDFAGCTLEGLMKSGDKESWELAAMKEIAGKSGRYEVYDYVKDKFGIDYIPKLERIEIDL